MAPRIPDLTILKRKMTSTFNGTVEEYADAWRKWRKKYAVNGVLSDELKQLFYKKKGVLYTEEGFKVRPNQSELGGVKNFTETLDDGMGDFRKAVRNQRETVLTYMFGGTELDIKKAAKLAREAGLGDRTAHHIFGGAEFAPFVDDIVEGLSLIHI